MEKLPTTGDGVSVTASNFEGRRSPFDFPALLSFNGVFDLEGNFVLSDFLEILDSGKHCFLDFLMFSVVVSSDVVFEGVWEFLDGLVIFLALEDAEV